MAQVFVVDNGKQAEDMRENAYQKWLNDVLPFVREQYSGKENFEWGYGYGRSGIWTYPSFSKIEFNYAGRMVTIHFADTYTAYRKHGPSLLAETPYTKTLPVKECQKLLAQLVCFAEKASRKTGYKIKITKHARIPFENPAP